LFCADWKRGGYFAGDLYGGERRRVLFSKPATAGGQEAAVVRAARSLKGVVMSGKKKVNGNGKGRGIQGDRDVIPFNGRAGKYNFKIFEAGLRPSRKKGAKAEDLADDTQAEKKLSLRD